MRPCRRDTRPPVRRDGVGTGWEIGEWGVGRRCLLAFCPCRGNRVDQPLSCGPVRTPSSGPAHRQHHHAVRSPLPRGTKFVDRGRHVSKWRASRAVGVTTGNSGHRS